MNKKTITPNPQQPVDRILTGQLPSALAELSEDTLSSCILPTSTPDDFDVLGSPYCSFDGDDE